MHGIGVATKRFPAVQLFAMAPNQAGQRGQNQVFPKVLQTMIVLAGEPHLTTTSKAFAL